MELYATTRIKFMKNYCGCKTSVYSTNMYLVAIMCQAVLYVLGIH